MIKPKQRYERITAGDYNKVVKELERLNNMRISTGSKPAIRNSPNGINIIVGGGRSVVEGGEAIPAEYVEVIAGLSFDDGEELGQSAYVCRLSGSNPPAAFDPNKTDYVAGNSALEDNRIYIAKAGYAFVSAPMPNPSEDPDNWQISDELQPYIWHEGTAVVDMRKYVPWLVEGEIYPVVKYGGNYYFTQQFTRIGTPGSRSISWNITDNRMMACVSDTVTST